MSLKLIHAQNVKSAASVAVLNLLQRIDVEDLEHGLEQESLTYGMLQGSQEHADWLAQQVPPQQTHAPGRIIVSRQADIIDIMMDRAKAHNAIDCDMRDALYNAFQLATLDQEVTAVRLHSAGKAFCIGADLSEFGTTRDPAVAHYIRQQTLPAHMILKCAHKMHVHIQGACIGAGLEMAAFAAHVTASSKAWFQLPELAFGLIPGAGGCVSVTKRIGRQRAAELILSGRRIKAATALEWGLIDAIVDNPSSSNAGPHIVR
jgi:enoyl-CoA hydratase/carnithine racemase